MTYSDPGHIGATFHPKGNGRADSEPNSEEKQPQRRMQLEWFSEACALALSDKSNPLIADILDESAMSVIYGESNSGKTFVTLDMAFAVSAGLSWNGKATKQGLVIYVAAEGGKRIMRRFAALKKHHEETYGEYASSPLLALVRYPIDLRSSEANLKELLALIRQAEEACGQKCAWIIVDTLSRALAGGDENSSVDMGRIVVSADRIRAATGAHFSYVHHTGKDGARGARGHSLLRAATDTEIETTSGALKVTKQRDMDGGQEFGFALVDVWLGEDAGGRPVKSAFVQWSDAPASGGAKQEKAVPRAQRLLLDAIAEAIDEEGAQFRPFGKDGPLVIATHDEEIRRRYYKRIAEQAGGEEDKDKLAERQRKAFNRALSRALDAKLIFARESGGRRLVWLP